jgi:hypothetical protein
MWLTVDVPVGQPRAGSVRGWGVCIALPRLRPHRWREGARSEWKGNGRKDTTFG